MGNATRLFIFVLIFLSLPSFEAAAQRVPAWSNFYMNPYMVNPAMGGIYGRGVVSANYKRQWVKVNEAPAIANIAVQLPFENRVTFGMNIYNKKYSLFSNTSVNMSMGYTVPFERDHYVSFGLGAGANFNSVDFSSLDDAQLADPMLASLGENGVSFQAQFGVHYYIKGLNLSLTLPGLFQDNQFNSENVDQFNLQPVDRLHGMAYYNFKLPANDITITPYAIYRYGYTGQSYYEGALIVDLREILWFGGSYRQDYGPSLLLGFGQPDKFKIGYAYEFAGELGVGIPGGTHEIQIQLLFGNNIDIFKGMAKKDKQKRNDKPQSDWLNEYYTKRNDVQTKSNQAPIVKVEPEPEPVQPTPEPEPEPVIPTPEPEPVVEPEPEPVVVTPEPEPVVAVVEPEPEPVVVEPEPEPVVPEPEPEPVLPEPEPEPIAPEPEPEPTVAVEAPKVQPDKVYKESDSPNGLKPGHYVVVAQYESEAEVEAYIEKMRQRGFYGQYGYSSTLKKYVIYTFKTESSDDVLTEKDRVKRISYYKDAYYLYVE
ncbi:PorP/SprF family type IX secretion system membrane protein [Marinigracilibium pacificum]|uniref:PorP/SprF family type IX secretion system membrane protein n=1 Tax=Marinigracilibium pacificum TaxID=2729599 RepID=A0A848J467_9BACT|nr:PorP/SprF family type IX secretion system membrane protein [Marinigracilibium pacificum]NMM49274.1 PorP/SprF family type IX secretion system membrane protein [Marinigracilibium pacificum]